MEALARSTPELKQRHDAGTVEPPLLQPRQETNNTGSGSGSGPAQTLIRNETVP